MVENGHDIYHFYPVPLATVRLVAMLLFSSFYNGSENVKCIFRWALQQVNMLTVYSGADQSKHQISASLAFVRGIQRWPLNSPHKGPVMRKIFPFNDVIMICVIHKWTWLKVNQGVVHIKVPYICVDRFDHIRKTDPRNYCLIWSKTLYIDASPVWVINKDGTVTLTGASLIFYTARNSMGVIRSWTTSWLLMTWSPFY